MGCRKLTYNPDKSPLFISKGVENARKSVQGFISADPLKDDYPQLNPYNYADNNPVSDLDIDGQQNTKTQKRGSVRAQVRQDELRRREQAKQSGGISPADKTDRFFAKLGEMFVENVLMNIGNSQSFEGYKGQSAKPDVEKAKQEIQAYKDLPKQLDPKVQAENFSRTIVTGASNFIEGVQGNPEKLAESVPFLIEAFGARSLLKPKTRIPLKPDVGDLTKKVDDLPQTNVADDPKGEFRGNIVKADASRINLIKEIRDIPKEGQKQGKLIGGVEHVREGHFGNAPDSKSIFSISENELFDLLNSDQVFSSPLNKLESGNFLREIELQKPIGNLSINRGGDPTSILTVITDVKGNLVTAFPGTTPYKKTP